MKILLLTNLYPPHLEDTDDFRCQNVADALRDRGHTIRVLTSTCGLADEAGHTARALGGGTEGRDALVQRRLRVNGGFGQTEVAGVGDLRELELRNNDVLREAISAFEPDLVHVGSLRGVSKSLILTLRRLGVPTCFDIADGWLAEELRDDPWLAWWNREKLPAMQKVQRTGLEVSGQRAKWDATTPTFLEPGVSRQPAIFDAVAGSVRPNSIAAPQFRRLFFSSPALRETTAAAGFRVAHGGVIHPGVDTRLFHGEPKPADATVKKFLIAARFTPHCGIATALEALQLLRAQGVKASLTVCGRGSSEVLAKLRTHAVQCGVTVEFRGGGVQRELPAIYRDHDAFIYPVEREEAFVGPPLEAMASGLPVIVSQGHGAEELFESPDSFLSFPSGEAGELAARMIELIQTPNLAAQLAQVGQNEVLTRYQFSTAVEQIESYFEDTVAQWQSA